MQLKRKLVGTCLIAGALALPLFTTACAEHRRGYYYNDPYYHDRHRWDNNEIVFYNQWTVETRRDQHRDFRNLNRDEQREYWEWRHHHNRDRDHDHDRDDHR